MAETAVLAHQGLFFAKGKKCLLFFKNPPIICQSFFCALFSNFTIKDFLRTINTGTASRTQIVAAGPG